jgi:alpha-1,3-glucan synthase
MNRNLAKWFILSESLSAFWLGNYYGRTWRFLWLQPISPWIIFCLVFFFFVIVWGLLLYLFQRWSKIHSWIMCIFAVGLVSPKWAQVFWSTSFVGRSLSWASSSGSILSLGLFCWLGVLDAFSQVGLSMMLLQTLTRIHVSAVLLLSQILSSIALSLSLLIDINPFPNIMYFINLKK